MLEITAIPALQDNYIWAIHDHTDALLVDPGEAQPALNFLRDQGLQLRAILCTHRHRDHIGGIAELRAVYNVPVYGHRHPLNPHITHDLHDGDELSFTAPSITFEIMELPGHLDDHIAYYSPGMVFSGDILFAAGCGKNFEGTEAQLHHSVQRLAALPDETLIYSAHEYAEYNLPFAARCEPDNLAIKQRIEDTRQMLQQGKPAVPFTIALEKATNPFMRCSSQAVIATLRQRGLDPDGNEAVFSALRAWRDHF